MYSVHRPCVMTTVHARRPYTCITLSYTLKTMIYGRMFAYGTQGASLLAAPALNLIE